MVGEISQGCFCPGLRTEGVCGMNPARVDRKKVRKLTDLPNIGPAMDRDLRLLGIFAPGQIAGECPYRMHARLSEITGFRQDPCVIDVFISITRFMAGGESRPWWEFTAERKKYLAGIGN